MKNQQYDLIVFGGVCCDIILSGLKELPQRGEEIWAEHLKMTVGGVFNVAAAAARLNMRAGCPCALGTDSLSEFISRTARKESVDTGLFLQVPTAYEQLSIVFNFGEERSFASFSANHLRTEVNAHIANIVREVQTAVAVFGISDEMQSIANMRNMRKKGTMVVLDCSWNREILNSLLLKEQIEASDYFFPNLKEAQEITGETDPERAATVLSRFCSKVVIKMGSEGALSSMNGKVKRHAAFNFGKVVDTTGAGDNFVAGFCYGLIHEFSPDECVRCGLLCGSKSVLAAGGFTASLYESELSGLLSSAEKQG